jgi:Protein of unknown function (DUF3987)
MEKSQYKPNGAPMPGGVGGQTKAQQSNRCFDDEDFLDQLVRLLVHDREASEQCAALGLDANDLKPLDGMKRGRPRWVVGDVALEHFKKHGEPQGALARAEVLTYAENLGMGSAQVNELKNYVEFLSNLKPVAPDSILESVLSYKSQHLKAAAIQELVELQSTGRLTDEKWHAISEKALAAAPELKTPDAPQWPEALTPEAFHGLAGDIVKALKPRTEADPAALLAQTLVAFGNVVGRGPHWMHGATRHALNLFVGIVGPTGSGKGSGLDQVQDIFREVDQVWSSNPDTHAGLASGEGFIKMVRDPTYRRKKDGELELDDPGVEDKRLLLIQPEFAQVLEVCERQGNTLTTKLRNAWDGKPLANNSLSSHLTATNAHISLIVHTTEDDLRDLMRRTLILNGFGNRFLWVCSRRSKLLPFGGMVPREEREALVGRLRDAVEFAQGLKGRPQRGRLLFEKRASDLWVSLYRTTLMRESENPVTGRACPQVRRMATIYALMDCREQVCEAHLRAALEMWRYCAEGARFIFGGVRRIDPEADKVLDAMRQRGKKGLTRKDISVEVFQRNKSAEEITRVLASLQKQGQARMQTEAAGDKGGRPTERWFSV